MCERSRSKRVGTNTRSNVAATFVFVIGVSGEATPTVTSHSPAVETPPCFRLRNKVLLTPQHMFCRTDRVKQLLPESAAGGSERVKLCMSSEHTEGERVSPGSNLDEKFSSRCPSGMNKVDRDREKRPGLSWKLPTRPHTGRGRAGEHRETGGN